MVYIIECRDKKLYTGITNNIERRIREHNNGKACRFTKSRWPVRLLFKEKCDNQSSARKREIQIKKLRKQEKLDLIRSMKYKEIS